MSNEFLTQKRYPRKCRGVHSLLLVFYGIENKSRMLPFTQIAGFASATFAYIVLYRARENARRNCIIQHSDETI